MKNMKGVLGALALSVAALGAGGCTMTTQPMGPTTAVRVHGGVGVVATRVPEDIRAYPHVRYHGREAYDVDGRWYYPSDQGWIVFQEVPPELQRAARTPGYGPAPGYARAAPGQGEYPPSAIHGPGYALPPPGAGVLPTEIGGYAVDPAAPPTQSLAGVPRAPFAGGEAYRIGGRWYYPTPQGWVVFRTTPTELGRWRTPIGGGALGYPER